MYKQILRNKDAHEAILKGVNSLADVVASTMGYAGKTVFIDRGYGTEPVSTKDGVTVAVNIRVKDKVENVGVELLKNAARETVAVAGDGTTQTIVLARYLMNEGSIMVLGGAQPHSLKKGFDKGIAKVVAFLKLISVDISGDHEKLVDIASISANNDREIGELIAGAYKQIGKNGRLLIEESPTIETYTKIVEGFEFDRGFMHAAFVNVPDKRQVVYNNPQILLVDYDVTNVKELFNILKPMVEDGRPIVLIVKGLEGEAHSSVIVNKTQNNIKICAIKAPATYMKECFDDLAVIIGATVIGDDNGLKLEHAKVEHLGGCERIICTDIATTIIGGKGLKSDIKDKVSEIEIILNEEDREDVKEVHGTRLARLTASVGVVYVGAVTPIEATEKRARVDDAVKASKSALEEGIVVGGGVALLKCYSALRDIACENESERWGVGIVEDMLAEPCEQILKNAGADEDILTKLMSDESLTNGFNVKTMKFGNLIEEGVIDATKVIRVALQNAASIAGNFVTSDSVLIEREWEEN